MKVWRKKTKGTTTLFFEKKMTQNEISTSKIDFLNNSDKTSKNGYVAGVIHGKNLKRLCSAGDLCPKFGGGCGDNNYSTVNKHVLSVRGYSFV